MRRFMTLTLVPTISPELAAYLDRADPCAHQLIIDIYQKWQANPSLGMKRPAVCALLNCGATSELQKEKAGILETYVDGAAVRVGTASAHRHAIELVIVSHPVDGPPLKARKSPFPLAKTQRRSRGPNPQELAALAQASPDTS
jgi:hypothetical protein